MISLGNTRNKFVPITLIFSRVQLAKLQVEFESPFAKMEANRHLVEHVAQQLGLHDPLQCMTRPVLELCIAFTDVHE